MRRLILSSLAALGAWGCSDTVGSVVGAPPTDRPEPFAEPCVAPDAATVCPATTVGDPWRLQLHRLAPIFVCAGGGVREPSLTTTPDGPVLAVTRDGVGGPEVAGYRLSPTGNPIGRAFDTVPDARTPRIAWSAGALALVTARAAPRGEGVSVQVIEAARTWRADVPAATVDALAPPAFNGHAWVIAWRTGATARVGVVTPSGFTPWHQVDDAGGSVALAADAASGTAWLAVERGAGRGTGLTTFDRIGRRLAPPGGAALGTHFGPSALAHDGSQRSALLAGYTRYEGRPMVTEGWLDVSSLSGGQTVAEPIGGSPAITPVSLTADGSTYGVVWPAALRGRWGVYALAAWHRTNRSQWIADELTVEDGAVATSSPPPIVTIARSGCGYLLLWEHVGARTGPLQAAVFTHRLP